MKHCGSIPSATEANLYRISCASHRERVCAASIANLLAASATTTGMCTWSPACFLRRQHVQGGAGESESRAKIARERRDPLRPPRACAIGTRIRSSSPVTIWRKGSARATSSAAAHLGGYQQVQHRQSAEAEIGFSKAFITTTSRCHRMPTLAICYMQVGGSARAQHC